LFVAIDDEIIDDCGQYGQQRDRKEREPELLSILLHEKNCK
jgi:hypothetical protein